MPIDIDEPTDPDLDALRETRDGLQEKHAHLDKQLKTLENHLDLGKRTMRGLERDIAVATAKIGQERQRIFKANHQKSRLDARFGGLVKEIASQKALLAKLKQSHTAINAQIETIGADLNALNAATAPLAAEKEACDKRIATLEDQKGRLLGDLDDDLAGSAGDREKRMLEIDATGKKLTQTIMARDDLRRDMTTQSTVNAELESRIKQLSDENRKLHTIKELRSRHDRIVLDIAKASDVHDQLNRSLETEQERLAAKEKALQSLTDDNTRLQRQIDALAPQLADYELMKDSLETCRQAYQGSVEGAAASETQLLGLSEKRILMAHRLRKEKVKADKMLQALKSAIRQANSGSEPGDKNDNSPAR